MSTKREIIATTEAPGAVGPYSQGIATDTLVFTAGQIPVNPATGKIEAETIEDQTRQVLRTSTPSSGPPAAVSTVVKMTVFMTDLGDFKTMNGVYAEFFPADPPARSAVQVVALPLGVQIEMEAIALTRERARILIFEFLPTLPLRTIIGGG